MNPSVLTPSDLNSAYLLSANNAANNTPAVAPLSLPQTTSSGLSSANRSSAQSLLNQAQSNTPTAGGSTSTSKPLSWWDRLAPTIGGVGGGILGTGLGALLTPLTAGIINPLDASTALSALGGGVGQAIQNKAEGKGLGIGKDLEEAGIMGGSNLLGAGIAKGIGAIGGGVADKLASQATDEALADTATKAYQAMGQTAREAYDLTGSQALAKSADIDPNDFAAMQQQGWGVTNAVDSRLDTALAGQQVDTGELSDLNDALQAKATARIGGQPINIDTSGLSPEAQKVIDAFDNADYTNPETQKYLNAINKINTGLLNDSGSIDASSFRSATQDIGRLEGQSIPKGLNAAGATDFSQSQLNKAMSTLYGYMNDSYFGADGVDDAVKSMTPDITAEEVGGSQKLADMGNEAIKSGDPQQIKNFLQQTGNMAKIGDEATNAAKGLVPQTATKGASTLSKGVKLAEKAGMLGGGYEALEGKSNKDRIIGGIVAAPEVLDLLGSSMGTKGASSLLSGLSRIAGVGAQAATTGAAGVATAPTAQPSANTSVGVPTMQSINPMTSPVMAALMNALGGGSDASSISTILPLAQKVVAAQNDLSTLASLYNQAGGAQGGIGGLLTRLQAMIPGSAAGQYLRAQPALANTLANLTGNTPTAVAGQMPTFTQTPQTAQINLSGLAGNLGLTY